MFAVDAPDLYGPFAFQPWWALGVALLFIIGLTFYFMWLWTRPRGILAPPPPPPRRVDVRTLKQKYLAMIDEVAAEHAAGDLTARELSQRLSLVLRFFAHESTGVVAEVMTLSDLAEADLPTVHGAVAEYYPSSFQRTARKDPDEAIEIARRVVSTWM